MSSEYLKEYPGNLSNNYPLALCNYLKQSYLYKYKNKKNCTTLATWVRWLARDRRTLPKRKRGRGRGRGRGRRGW